jgi:hypothetical protein
VLKLISIPVVIEEKSWDHRFPQTQQQHRLSEGLHQSKAKRTSPTKVVAVTKSEKRSERKRINILSTQRTRSGRLVAHKRCTEDELIGETSIEAVAEVEDDEDAAAAAQDHIQTTTTVQIVQHVEQHELKEATTTTSNTVDIGQGIQERLGSVAGPVIQATGRSEFADGLGSGDFVSGYSYHMSVRTGLPDHTMQTKFQSQRPSDVETTVPSI